MVRNFERLESELMQVELPQLEEEDSLDDEIQEMKDFKDQIYLQIKTSTSIAQKDLKENVDTPRPKMKKVKEFGNTLKSSLIQYLEQESKNAPVETIDVQLSSQGTKAK